ncbi:MAG: calcium/sodium antiporter [Sulfurovum sp.]|nr:calcium/sodium antiporter [Sulfurovaceae bacterium]
MDFVIFVVAMATLIWGADVLVQESEKIAMHFNISDFIIGATLIALGTSLPEMAASIIASINNKPQIAIANVIGSNILNITMVLGTIFIITKKSMSPDRDFFAKDSYWAIVPIFVFILIAFDGVISRFDSIILLILMAAYILFLIREAKGIVEEQVDDDIDKSKFRWYYTLPLIFVSIISVVVGANFTVDSASNIAKSFGISEWVIGMIMISVGTSLPELAVSITASIRGKVDMAIGNIIGSNMANTTIVLGFAGLAQPLHIDIFNHIFDILTMLIATFMLVFLTANKLYNKPAGISLYVILFIFLEHTLATI